MTKVRRLLVLGVLAALLTPFAPAAQAKYPPTLEFRACAQLLNSLSQLQGAFLRGERAQVFGRPGCALTDDGTAKVNVRMFLAYRNTAGIRQVIQRNRLGADNGSYRLHFSIPTNAEGGLQRIIIRTLDDQAIQPIRIRTLGTASASLPATKTTVPMALALGIMAIGALFVFTPVGRRGWRLVRRGAG